MLAPALRLGWLVVPERLREGIVKRKQYNDMGTATIPQAAFAHLLRTGGYDRHLRRTRALYRKRRDALLEAVAEHLPRGSPSASRLVCTWCCACRTGRTTSR